MNPQMVDYGFKRPEKSLIVSKKIEYKLITFHSKNYLKLTQFDYFQKFQKDFQNSINVHKYFLVF